MNGFDDVETQGGFRRKWINNGVDDYFDFYVVNDFDKVEAKSSFLSCQ